MKSPLYLVFFISLTYCSPLLTSPNQFKPSPNIVPYNNQSPNLDESPWDIRINGENKDPTIISNTDYKGQSLSPLSQFKPPSANIPKPLTNSPGIMQIPGASMIKALFTGLFNNGAPKNGIY
ncbi:hypothetical protein CONCODRAFT_4272 [Conidiobolus coronatus NRRL 28638]|uniref:Uncharacterized protein n=1 Tax=Conidiobolus coronatus (strain ATCC 28846 / CBS 209.66 / NRRL 28638) TaxID=796925 RepID=A0A137PD01_CONC2|nr:hypothetical protein CONCODRAFT_4272 [Conidiobolus coronatus NRRL 28638]|eukprot:KXN72877.1 hypothetical protein CONCODRAFT_4272 [Conidiobolus coronatus NRRL 28638]